MENTLFAAPPKVGESPEIRQQIAASTSGTTKIPPNEGGSTSPNRKVDPVSTFSPTDGRSVRRIKALVLGAGIYGSAVSSMMAASGYFEVTNVDRSGPGAGISGTNQGRQHSTFWNHHHNDKETARLAKEALQLLKQLPNVLECNENGLYCTTTVEGRTSFELYAAEKEVSYRRSEDANRISDWIDPTRYECFDIPESSFNPAGLCGGLVGAANALGGYRFEPVGAKRIDHQKGIFRITLLDGRVLEADIVVNAMGGWLNSLETTLDLWHPNLRWSYWRLLCVNSDDVGLKRLDRVITVDRTNGDVDGRPGPLAAVPHGPIVVFGCDVTPKRMESQDQVPPGQDFRPMNLDDEQDEFLFEEHAFHFPILRKLRENDRTSSIFSFPGVYPEVQPQVDGEARTAPTPYNNDCTWEHGGVEGYYPLFGGSATTALVNARNATRHILSKSNRSITEGERDAWIERIARAFPSHVQGRMIWDVQGMVRAA